MLRMIASDALQEPSDDKAGMATYLPMPPDGNCHVWQCRSAVWIRIRWHLLCFAEARKNDPFHDDACSRIEMAA